MRCRLSFRPASFALATRARVRLRPSRVCTACCVAACPSSRRAVLGGRESTGRGPRADNDQRQSAGQRRRQPPASSARLLPRLTSRAERMCHCPARRVLARFPVNRPLPLALLSLTTFVAVPCSLPNTPPLRPLPPCSRPLTLPCLPPLSRRPPRPWTSPPSRLHDRLATRPTPGARPCRSSARPGAPSAASVFSILVSARWLCRREALVVDTRWRRRFAEVSWEDTVLVGQVTLEACARACATYVCAVPSSAGTSGRH